MKRPETWACCARSIPMLTRREFLYQTTGTLTAIAGASAALAQKSGIQVFYDRSVLLHQPSADHPESPQRITAVLSTVRQLEQQGRVSVITPHAANEEEILLVHSTDYIKKVRAEIAAGRQ